MKKTPENDHAAGDEQALEAFRRQNEKAWRHILSMSDVLDKGVVDLSLAGDENSGCDPYDTSVRLRQLSA